MCPCSEHFSTKERDTRVYKLFISTKITPLPCKREIYVLYSPHTPEREKEQNIVRYEMCGGTDWRILPKE